MEEIRQRCGHPANRLMFLTERLGNNMEYQGTCPACGRKSLIPVLRKTMMSTSERSENGRVLAYRCENGHLYIKRVNAADDEAPPKAA